MLGNSLLSLDLCCLHLRWSKSKIFNSEPNHIKYSAIDVYFNLE